MPPDHSREETAARERHSGRRYLDRLGVDPDAAGTADLAALTRLQAAHVRAVPFENLAIVGDPHKDRTGAGVTLSTPALYEKVVNRERGGYCFELNGLFHWLLSELGYDVDRIAARVTSGDGVTLPANHHANLVRLESGRYVVDVGVGTPKIRRPIPLEGPPVTDAVGVEWRVRESDRPDVDYRTEFREPADDEWTRRYVFGTTPRPLGYFEATNDYLQAAPESPFTGAPTVSVGTETGSLKLTADTLVERGPDGETERAVDPDEWHRVLEERFGLTL